MTRQIKLLLGTAVGVIIAAVTAVTVLAVVNYDRGDNTARLPMPAAVQQLMLCADHVILYFRTDEAMTTAVAELRKDPQVGSVKGETKAAAYERFKEIFADQPELLELATPESMPATAEVGPAGDADAERLAGRFRSDFHETDDVNVLPCQLG